MNSDEAGMCMAILIVSDDDLATESRVADLLRRCDYRVLRTQTVNEALREIYEKKERLDLVITNLNKLETGVATIQIINQTFKLNVLSIPCDERIQQQQQKEVAAGYSVYIVKGLNLNSAALKNLMGNNTNTTAAKGGVLEPPPPPPNHHHHHHQQNTTSNININTNVERESAAAAAFAIPSVAETLINKAAVNAGHDQNVETITAAAAVAASASVGEINAKRAFGINGTEHDQLYSSSSSSSQQQQQQQQQPQPQPQPKGRKKARVTWTDDMHNKFLKAIQILGDDKAVPNKILELMKDFPELTRENVASHLQKHRYTNNAAHKSSKQQQ